MKKGFRQRSASCQTNHRAKNEEDGQREQQDGLNAQTPHKSPHNEESPGQATGAKFFPIKWT